MNMTQYRSVGLAEKISNNFIESKSVPLVPLTLPIIVVAVYFHWLSMKMFKHA
ncbi:transmembrane protein, putative [Medicago truncatula]|uniref:Transmembrane protein, putative n=1 Tax=Medicago truncatula TaxID=3880 RepID=G7IYX0_MEDTR|nr:transmembrane protein, putative [Medicago truncatula]